PVYATDSAGQNLRRRSAAPASRRRSPARSVMPVFRSDQTPPAWCELRSFAIIDLANGEDASYRRTEPHERLLMTFGTIQLIHAGGSVVLKENQFTDLSVDDWRLKGCSTRAQI